jgi:hypothetical protein
MTTTNEDVPTWQKRGAKLSSEQRRGTREHAKHFEDVHSEFYFLNNIFNF